MKNNRVIRHTRSGASRWLKGPRGTRKTVPPASRCETAPDTVLRNRFQPGTTGSRPASSGNIPGWPCSARRPTGRPISRTPAVRLEEDRETRFQRLSHRRPLGRRSVRTIRQLPSKCDGIADIKASPAFPLAPTLRGRRVPGKSELTISKAMDVPGVLLRSHPASIGRASRPVRRSHDQVAQVSSPRKSESSERVALPSRRAPCERDPAHGRGQPQDRHPRQQRRAD